MNKRVKFLASFSGPTSYQAGQAYDLADTFADRLIASGDAILASDDNIIDPTELADALANVSAAPSFVAAAELNADIDIASMPHNFGGLPFDLGVGLIAFLGAQTDPTQNGPWVSNGYGNAFTRPDTWASGSTQKRGQMFYVLGGKNIGALVVCNNILVDGNSSPSGLVDTDSFGFGAIVPADSGHVLVPAPAGDGSDNAKVLTVSGTELGWA